MTALSSGAQTPRSALAVGTTDSLGGGTPKRSARYSATTSVFGPSVTGSLEINVTSWPARSCCSAMLVMTAAGPPSRGSNV